MVQVQQRGREFKKERSANFFFASFARRLIIKFCVKFVTICCKIGKLSHVATYKRSCRKKEQEAGGCTAWFRCSSEAAKFPDKFKVAFRKFFLCFAREAKFVANLKTFTCRHPQEEFSQEISHCAQKLRKFYAIQQ
jgi:hypothetical protein